MSNVAEREAEDAYERENDESPVPGTVQDDTYVRETDPSIRDKVPVVGDNEDYDEPMQPPYSNSDAQLADDENEAIDPSNIIDERLRHARPRTKNGYDEGLGEDDLPEGVRQGDVGVSGTTRIS
ncbi:hypothetical protein ASPZODRAFT_15997 [Penicilliopsis zonata CBS 506.65]|uniref:Histone chaperone domain-containing protein n=1 Tax=Penicilliopsis zonata CBS 506.65 TaxID=1073090 RepID=A0A1L9SJI1_9EURO|nr:hypothetical protein ASPZODRAFT_15997 [Penicilliopsis zonata CBS 506.65]OJJ47315.1 hypothetical protein ASPZODRAFT_15997 [Penicilliopsis zonata CBS 506.65]